jgi:hypothetical protein
MEDKRFLLTGCVKTGGMSFWWFDTEEELIWFAKNNTAIEVAEAFEIGNVRSINLE